MDTAREEPAQNELFSRKQYSGFGRPISVQSRSSRRPHKNATTVSVLSNKSNSIKLSHTAWANQKYYETASK